MAAADPNGPITVTPELSADKDTATYKIGIDPTKIAESTILTYKDNDGTDKTVTLKKGLNFKKWYYDDCHNYCRWGSNC